MSSNFEWILAASPRDQAVLTRWCQTVGPPLVQLRPARPGDGREPLVVVSWNVHEGAADVRSFVAALRRGEFTEGVCSARIVLLVQETVRADSALPPVDADDPVPHPIAPKVRSGPRVDVVALARLLDASFAYVPSMRNGRSRAEDRGNAIVSTVPFSKVSAIELPFEHQRRVAIAALLDTSPTLRIVSVHLDTTAGLRRGGPLAGRRRQARALVDALAADDKVATVIGGDFNTWLGRAEPAYQEIATRYPELLWAPVTWSGTLGLGAPLDHVFARVPPSLHMTARALTRRFGSDHIPIVVQIWSRPPT